MTTKQLIARAVLATLLLGGLTGLVLINWKLALTMVTFFVVVALVMWAGANA